jgi:hypothetical protein
MFYYYPKNSNESFIAIRNDTLLKEVNIKKGDTSLWKINWLSDCKYSVHYISGINMDSKEMEQFYKATQLNVSIQKVTANYYIFSAEVTSPKQKKVFSDTVWMIPRK